MRIRLALALMVMSAGGVIAQVTNYQPPGNLAPTMDPGCVALAEVDARLSPPDLALGVLACGRDAKWEAAADLYVLMLLRSSFDVARVKDATAHQAGDVLSLQVSDALSDADRASIGNALASFGDPAGPRMLAFCEVAKALGASQHDPSWMLQHGIGAFLGTKGDGLVKGFDPAAAWDRIIREDMTCG